MQLITTDAILRQFIPNAFATVTGETPFFDKLRQHLSVAESWLEYYIVSPAVLSTIAGYADDNEMKVLARSIVAADAFARAVPSLDLVLTPNGFGIVSTQNVAPASKERVERLIRSLSDVRDAFLERLLPMLAGVPQWVGSSCGRFFAASLFPHFDLVRLVEAGMPVGALPKGGMCLWDRYLSLRSRLLLVEQDFMENVISPEQMAVFHGETIEDAFSSESHRLVVTRLRALAVRRLQDMALTDASLPVRCRGEEGRALIGIVDFMRKHPEDFTEWHASATARLFDPPVFENKKESGGFWF